MYKNRGLTKIQGFPGGSCGKESYSAIRRIKIMLSEAIWMDLDIVIPSEVSQTEKDKSI